MSHDKPGPAALRGATDLAASRTSRNACGDVTHAGTVASGGRWLRCISSAESVAKQGSHGLEAEGEPVEHLTYVVPPIGISALVASVAGVLRDARVHANTGHPVAVYLGEFQIEKPEAWASACLVMWIVFFPLHLKARSKS